MCVTCERCGKLTRHYQTLANGKKVKKVCADDRNCWPMEKKYTPPPHLIKQLNTLQARYAR